MKRILLINPRYEMETLRVTDEDHIDARADNMPLGLATVAALTPDPFQVEIWDEFVRGPIEACQAPEQLHFDLVGVTTTRVTILRAREIANFFRRRGVLVAAGGPGVSGTPDRCRTHFDILFIGEAEIIWPEFLNDWQGGGFRPEYRQIEKPDIALSPMPRWEIIAEDAGKYAMGSVQTTRGCPFDCEFCDVVYLNGRKQRHKTIERVLAEVKALERLGVSTVYFADDNLVVDHKYAKDLLRELIPLNLSFAKPLRFATQASIDASRDAELLELLADANFYEMLIGIESPNKESLKAIGKFNNLKGDLIEEIRRILSYGISVRGAFICGLDQDGTEIFDLLYEFLHQACIPSVSLHMLNAPIGTRLWRRLREEGRVIDVLKITDQFTRRIISNVIPKKMSRIELMEGFADLYARVFSWESFTKRMTGFVELAGRPPQVPQEPVTLDQLKRLGPSLGLPPDACQAMDRIFELTAARAPYLLSRVKALVVQFIRYSDSARKLVPNLKRQIELESSGALTYELDSRPVTVPTGFRKAFRAIFPAIYRRTYLNLAEKQKVPAALVDVFVDFLVHEEGFDQYQEAYHLPMLQEIADRTCARMNGQEFQDFISADAGAPVPEGPRMRLGEDILNSVEQELLKLSLPAAQSPAN